MIRGRIRLQQHVKAITAEGRFTGYVLVAFPAVLFVVSYALNPDYAGMLLNKPALLRRGELDHAAGEPVRGKQGCEDAARGAEVGVLHADRLRLRFGLGNTEGGEEPQTLEAIGRRLGVTRERVRQIESAGLRKLRALLAARGVDAADLL